MSDYWFDIIKSMCIKIVIGALFVAGTLGPSTNTVLGNIASIILYFLGFMLIDYHKYNTKNILFND